jgi:hypothetical protein
MSGIMRPQWDGRSHLGDGGALTGPKRRSDERRPTRSSGGCDHRQMEYCCTCLVFCFLQGVHQWPLSPSLGSSAALRAGRLFIHLSCLPWALELLPPNEAGLAFLFLSLLYYCVPFLPSVLPTTSWPMPLGQPDISNLRSHFWLCLLTTPPPPPRQLSLGITAHSIHFPRQPTLGHKGGPGENLPLLNAFK